jgi:hypothetical protein
MVNDFTHVGTGENGEPIVQLEVVGDEGHVRVGSNHDLRSNLPTSLWINTFKVRKLYKQN